MRGKGLKRERDDIRDKANRLRARGGEEEPSIVRDSTILKNENIIMILIGKWIYEILKLDSSGEGGDKNQFQRQIDLNIMIIREVLSKFFLLD